MDVRDVTGPAYERAVVDTLPLRSLGCVGPAEVARGVVRVALRPSGGGDSLHPAETVMGESARAVGLVLDGGQAAVLPVRVRAVQQRFAGRVRTGGGLSDDRLAGQAVTGVPLLGQHRRLAEPSLGFVPGRPVSEGQFVVGELDPDGAVVRVPVPPADGARRSASLHPCGRGCRTSCAARGRHTPR